MAAVLYLMQDFASLAVLAVISFVMLSERNLDSKRRIFVSSCISYGSALCLDIAGSLCMGRYTFISLASFNVNTVCLCAGVFFWCLYALYSLDSSLAYKNTYRTILMFVYIVAAFFGTFVFGLKFEDGVYTEDPNYVIVFYTLYIVPFCIGVKAFVRSRKKKHFSSRREYMFIGVFSFMIIIPMILDKIYFIGANQSSVIMIASLLIFLNMQQERISIDSLTGISNRTVLVKKIEQAINQKNYSKYLFMIDVNSFKLLNDTYGHVEGDNALVLIANVLKNIVSRDMVVARYGGDEFAVLGSLKSDEDAENLIEFLNVELDSRCRSSGKDWIVSASSGYARLDESIKTVPDFISAADSSLYGMKKKFHSR